MEYLESPKIRKDEYAWNPVVTSSRSRAPANHDRRLARSLAAFHAAWGNKLTGDSPLSGRNVECQRHAVLDLRLPGTGETLPRDRRLGSFLSEDGEL